METDGAIRLGLRYVAGLREDVGRAIESAKVGAPTLVCPKCGCDDASMLETVDVLFHFAQLFKTREHRLCFLGLASSSQKATELVVGVHEMWRRLNRAPAVLDGLVDIARGRVQPGEFVVRVRRDRRSG